MNSKKSKQVINKSNELFVAWLKGLLRKEEADKVTLDNYWKFLPKQTHVFANNQWWLAAYSPRLISRKIKRMLKADPLLQINNITLDDLKNNEKAWKRIEKTNPYQT